MGERLPSDRPGDPFNRLGGTLPQPLPPDEAFDQLFTLHFKADLNRLLALYREKPDEDHTSDLLPFADRLGDPNCALLVFSRIGKTMPEHAAVIHLMIRDLDRHLSSAGHTRSPLMRLLAIYSHNPHGNHAAALLSYADRHQGGPRSALTSLSLIQYVMPEHEALLQAIIRDFSSFVLPKGGPRA